MFSGSQGLPLFRAFGINVTASWSWLLALGYVVVVLSGSYQRMLGDGNEEQAFAYAVVVAFAFFGSIIFHEFGHALVARRNGIGILGIELWMLGGLAKMDRDPTTPGTEFRVAAAGPLATAVVAAICLGSAAAIDSEQFGHLVTLSSRPTDDAWLASIVWLGVVNMYLLAFNLLPAFPLDGGRIARAIVWRITGEEAKGTAVAAGLGRGFGVLLMIAGVLLIAYSPFTGIILLFMGFVIGQAARSIIVQRGILGDASRLTVADAMDRQPVTIEASTTAERALDEYFWRYRWPWFPVVDGGGRFIGLIEQHSAEIIDEADRGLRRVAEMIVPGSMQQRAIATDTPLTGVLANPAIRDFGALIAVDDEGVLRGVITIEQVQRALRDAIERAAAAPASANRRPPGDP